MFCLHTTTNSICDDSKKPTQFLTILCNFHCSLLNILRLNLKNFIYLKERMVILYSDKPVASPHKCLAKPTTNLLLSTMSTLWRIKSAISARILHTRPFSFSNLLSNLCLWDARSIKSKLVFLICSTVLYTQ